MMTIKDYPLKIVQADPYLKPYASIINRRLSKLRKTEERLTQNTGSLADFASGHEYFGLHFDISKKKWVFREWAPNAKAIYLVGEMTNWRESETFKLEKVNPPEGIWELWLEPDAIGHQMLYRLRMHWPHGVGDRIPTYARRVVQDPDTLIFNAQVWRPPTPYQWKNERFKGPKDAPLIYEAHVGMAQEAEKVGTYNEFTETVLPKIIKAGYNTIQLMAIQEHPYYGSFGYQVSNFFAPSSRFGTPEELKELVDAVHGAGLRIVMDIVHSHAVSNEVEGLSLFDGTNYQFFHEGPRGYHEAWNSRCFDYAKYQVLHFLLSNCRYWLDEFHFDGFRFDGVTSMLYLHHGLGKAFTGYDDYFDDSVDEDAIVYLGLANKLIHTLRPDAATIAEDVSGMPGLAAPVSHGGLGFDYRFAMGVPDYWIKLVKEVKDEDWFIGHLWYELNNRRREEKTISYAESHDQALVGDQTLVFRLMGEDMYSHMRVDDTNLNVDRGIAILKLIRLITITTAGHGYLNFMGNEFGHPEWIDFPREGNQWSYRYARRQWRLAEDPLLKYRFMAHFDRDMIGLAKSYAILNAKAPDLLHEHNDNKVIVFQRAGLIFAFNFHPANSHRDYRFVAEAGKYRMVMNTDDPKYGGHDRLAPFQVHLTQFDAISKHHLLKLYLPTRTAVILASV